MSGADTGPLARRDTSVGTPLPRQEDRWLWSRGSKAHRITTLTTLVLLASVAFHGAFVATALFSDSAAHPPPEREISVELVSDESKPLDEAKAPAKAPNRPPLRTKPEDPKPLETKLEPPKPPEAKVEEAKLAEPKQEEAKPPEAKPIEPPVKVAEKPPTEPKEQAELKALQKELAALQAQHAEPEAKAAALPAPPRPAPRDALGPLPGSFLAVALPSGSDADGEAVSYSALVFSQLAKAKGIGRRQGQPGTAGVRFDVGDKGDLIDVALVASSGIKALDDEAVGIVRKAAPFPVPPQGAQRNFTANVSFIGEGAR